MSSSKANTPRALETEKQQIKTLQLSAWVLSVMVSAIAIFVWGHDNGWQLLPFNSYQFFPVLGLLAFSIMWTHYVMGAARELAGLPKGVLAQWFRYTGYVVLVAICLHPGLLIYQRFRDGHGLPPGSYESYVAQGLGWVTILGTASLCVFLAFELHRFFGQKSWWHYVADSSDAAMLAIFYHSLRLGTQLMANQWFKTIWYFYGLTLTAVLIRKYTLLLTARKHAE